MLMRSFTSIPGARLCPRAQFLLSTRNFSFQAVRFAKSSMRQASKTKATPPSIKQSTYQTTKTPTQSYATSDFRFMGRRSGSLAELDRKVALQGTVLLYEASSQRAYIFGAYGIAAFAFGYAFINSSIGLQDGHVQLATWQKSLYVGICIVMSAMGTVFLMRTSRLVKSITAVDSMGQTLLNVSVRSMVPFRKPYTITVAPNQMIFAQQLTASSNSPLSRSPSARDFGISVFRNPLKSINFTFFRIFISIRRIFTQEDFIMLEMQGQKGAFRVGLDGNVSDDLLAIGSATGRYKGA